ncbi:MAG: ATP-dependent DNA helicase RecQ, partial [Actinomycetota bacterium]
ALPQPGLAPAAEWLEAARAFSRGVDIVVEPRKLWPQGVGRRGRIAGLLEGRAVAFADDPGWGEALRDLQRSGYGTLPDSLINGAVEVLRRWAKVWPLRPAAVVPAAAFGAQGEANRRLAVEMARIGKLEMLDVLRWVGGEVPADLSSGPAVRHLESAIVLDAPVEPPPGPVLLCAASMRSGWTLTVCAAVLHEAGIRGSLPLVIHRLP